jgi:hypothetical protein
LVRAPACHAGGRGFESRRSRPSEALQAQGFSRFRASHDPRPVRPLPRRLRSAALTGAIDYAASGPLTGLEGVRASVLADIPRDAVEICRPVHSLVIQPSDAESLGAAADRFSENQIRPVGKLIDALLALDPAPLAVAREPESRPA